MLKRILLSAFLLSRISVLPAQNFDPAVPVHNDILIEIISPTLQISNTPQILQAKITVQTTLPVRYLDLKFSEGDANWSLLAASLNGNAIWLVQSDTTVNKTDVLGWTFDKSTFTLRLFPVSWNIPYALDLDVQIDWNDLKSMENITVNRVLSRVQLPDTLYSCSVSGRGIQVDLQK